MADRWDVCQWFSRAPCWAGARHAHPRLDTLCQSVLQIRDARAKPNVTETYPTCRLHLVVARPGEPGETDWKIQDSF